MTDRDDQGRPDPWKLLREAEAERDALAAQIAGLREALEKAKHVAAEAYREWDADNDPRVGKLLAALAGSMPKYRADIDAIHAALAASAPEGEQP